MEEKAKMLCSLEGLFARKQSCRKTKYTISSTKQSENSQINSKDSEDILVLGGCGLSKGRGEEQWLPLHENFFWEAQEPGGGGWDDPGEGSSKCCMFLFYLNQQGANSHCVIAQVQSSILAI